MSGVDWIWMLRGVIAARMRLSWRLWGWILARRRDVEKEEAVVLVSIGRMEVLDEYIDRQLTC